MTACRNSNGRGTMIRIFTLVLLLLWASVAMATDITVGDQVVLRAQHPLGVPLHREPYPSLLGRGLDGAEARVLRTEQDGRWAQIEISGGPTAWALSRYLANRGDLAGGTSQAGSDSVASPIWSSPDECRTRVAVGERLQKASDAVRVVSWNIRFFPNSGTQTDEIRTDLGWLSCV